MAERNLLWSWKTEPDAVFENLQWTRMKVQLNDSDRAEAIAAIQDVLKKLQEDDKRHVLFSIAYAVQQELFKSKEIDVEIIKKLAALYPRCVEDDDDDDDHDHDDNWLTAAAGDFKLSADAEEEEEDEADDADAADEDWEEYVDEDEDEAVAVADSGDDDYLKKREAAMKEFEEAGIKELKRQCNSMGCSLKQGQEQEILSVMISFFSIQKFRVDHEYRMKRCIEFFMSRVKGYISRSCILDDLETVHKALESVKKEREADADQVPQLLGKNTVPTNEEGIATPMNQLKQEKTERGIECEIATSFNLPEQEEITLTPPEFEDTKTEECGIVTPMNQPEQEEENMVDVNFCLAPQWKDVKTEECTTRGRDMRKLPQL
ncbi:uncharacterized protein LOC133746522 [Rosa rugosa]|uniref:uncharacterized protein LOC133746522 n=1 Tax=Rosa rugosa TaxID=74645 RepID=UPI002B4013B4|nr:uncharacterized protein LOC133746522 [Rosa rugosa]XP_062030677.1 uncharacterized protein LOC133746522 [Rosa rugosa]